MATYARARSGRTRADRGATRVRARGGGGGARRDPFVRGEALEALFGGGGGLRKRGLRDRGTLSPHRSGRPPLPTDRHLPRPTTTTGSPRNGYVRFATTSPPPVRWTSRPSCARTGSPTVARVRDQTRLRRGVSHPRRRLRDRGRFPDAPRPRCCVSTVSSRKGARAEAATETAESARAALRAAVRETTEEEDATPGRRFSSPPRGYGHGARGRPVRCQAPWVWAPREDSRARTAVCARTRRPSRFPRTRGRDYEPRFRKTATTSVPRMKASVRESPPRTTFRTTTRVDFEPVTSATTMTTFASSRRSAGQSGGARAPAAPGYPRASALAPAAAFRALALALARVSRVVLGGVRGMRGGARGDRRGEERTARARRGARRDVRFDASPRGD